MVLIVLAIVVIAIFYSGGNGQGFLRFRSADDSVVRQQLRTGPALRMECGSGLCPEDDELVAPNVLRTTR